jgi:hypothetical protein
MTKRALVVIQGINNKQKYMMPTTDKVKAFYAGYDAIEYTQTEKIFDKGWFAAMFDTFDFIPYFTSEEKRKLVCRHVNEQIATLMQLGYEVDVLAHSLGCVIGLQSGRKNIPIRVENFYALQSPMHNKIYGDYVADQIIKYSNDLIIGKLHTTYNKKDWRVASQPLKMNFLYKLLEFIRNIKQIIAGKGHDWELALVELLYKNG